MESTKVIVVLSLKNNSVTTVAITIMIILTIGPYFVQSLHQNKTKTDKKRSDNKVTKIQYLLLIFIASLVPGQLIYVKSRPTKT
jgi:hypothetical protein